MFIKRFC